MKVCVHTCTFNTEMDFASFSKQTCGSHTLRWVCIPMIWKALTQRPNYGNTALKFQWSNAEGIALSMKSRCYVICFQHLFSAVFRLYSTVISLPLSPIQATLHSKSLYSTRPQEQRAYIQPESSSESYFTGHNVHFLLAWHIFSHATCNT